MTAVFPWSLMIFEFSWSSDSYYTILVLRFNRDLNILISFLLAELTLVSFDLSISRSSVWLSYLVIEQHLSTKIFWPIGPFLSCLLYPSSFRFSLEYSLQISSNFPIFYLMMNEIRSLFYHSSINWKPLSTDPVS